MVRVVCDVIESERIRYSLNEGTIWTRIIYDEVSEFIAYSEVVNNL